MQCNTGTVPLGVEEGHEASRLPFLVYSSRREFRDVSWG